MTRATNCNSIGRNVFAWCHDIAIDRSTENNIDEAIVFKRGKNVQK